MICPKCGKDTYFMNSDVCGLVTLNKTLDNKIAANLNRVFPVHVFLCRSCKHVELEWKDPEE